MQLESAAGKLRRQIKTDAGCSGFATGKPSRAATRQSFWSAATNTLTIPARLRPSAMDSWRASRVPKCLDRTVLEKQLPGASKVFIVDGSHQEPAAAEICFQASPCQQNRRTIDLSGSCL